MPTTRKVTTRSAEKQTSRSARADGDTTRARLLDVAGKLFAEKGYADTTSKAICQAAQSNIAAVNYHFGSREGLYQEVLKSIHHHVIALDFIQHLADSDLPPQEKLSRCIEGVCKNFLDIENWQARLWARELLSPSALFSQVLQTEALPKFDVLRRILAEVMVLPIDDPLVIHSTLNVISPFLVRLVMNRSLPGAAQLNGDTDISQLAACMKSYVSAGLAEVSKLRTESNIG